MINLEVIGLLFDFGLVVLIWLVQLVIYPSFSGYQKENLIKWHEKYVSRMTYIVMPLMVGQLSLVVTRLFTDYSWPLVLNLLLIITAWAFTFFLFIPMHNKIVFGFIDEKILNQLVRKNWIRTILWNLVMLSSLVQYFR